MIFSEDVVISLLEIVLKIQWIHKLHPIYYENFNGDSQIKWCDFGNSLENNQNEFSFH